ncbi:hypothetical protein EXS83_05220 [Helicobacter pylori]|nr:hypothetical protein [Helicobacter pylori]
MGDKIDLISLCDGFIKYTQTAISYLVKATQDILISILKPTTLTTQSETESIFLYLPIQMLLNLTQHADKNLPNKTRL